jgi:transposase
MPHNFLPCDRERVLLLPPSLADWLPADHFARFVLEVVEELDLVDLYRAYGLDGRGRAALDPEMMVGLLVLRLTQPRPTLGLRAAGADGRARRS